MAAPACKNDQPASIANNEDEVLNVVIESDISDEWLRSIMDESSSNKMRTHKIQKVPQILRQMEPNKKYYDPEVVSIGPYHHVKEEVDGKDSTLKPLEEFKIEFTREYVKSCDPPSIAVIYNKVVEVADEARKCYVEGSTEDFNDRDFTQMMFLDGCFILQFIYYMGNEKEKIKMKMKNHVQAFVQRDLFLLENQLPFIVLRTLMNMNSKFVEGMTLIKEFIKKMRGSPPEDSFLETVEHFIGKLITNRQIRHDEAGSEPAHLLELKHSQLINPKDFESSFISYSYPLMIRLLILLNVFRFFKIPKGSNNTNIWYSYRSVQELMAAGIKFRPNKETNFLTDVRYEPLIMKAILRLPPITIDDSTPSSLLNLVAYEMCPDSPNDFGITSYLWFMDTLIDEVNDVKELRKKGILLNYLGSDQEVAGLFNEIAKNLVPNPHAYEDVKKQIERHYKNSAILWMTEWLHTHFSSPWTILAFLGAILAIALSFVQTYYAVNPKDNGNSTKSGN